MTAGNTDGKLPVSVSACRFNVASSRGSTTRRRVAAGDCSPAAPTDPDVPNSGIRLLGLDMRYAT